MLTALCLCDDVPQQAAAQVSGFLQLDVKDTVICIGGFVFGPLAAAIISIVVAVVEMFTVSDTGPIGCIMNVLATVSFCCTASFVYKKMHTKRGAVVGLSLARGRHHRRDGAVELFDYAVVLTGFSRSDIADMLVPIFLPFKSGQGRIEHGFDPSPL